VKSLNREVREGSWWSKWFTKAAFLALLSSVAVALGSLFNKHILQSVIISPDDTSAVLVFLLIGSWVRVPVNWGLNFIFGNRIEQDYHKLTYGSAKTQTWAVTSGIIGAIQTWCFLLAVQSLDPSVITALGGLAVIYLVFYDVIKGAVSWRKVWFVVTVVLVGGFLTSVNKFELSFSVLNWGAFLLLVVGRYGLGAVSSVVDQEGSRSSDGVTYSFWRGFWFALSSTVLVILVSYARGYWQDFVITLRQCLLVALPWNIVLFLISYFSVTLRNTASRYGAISVVSILNNFSIVLIIPLTIATNYLLPGFIGEIPSDIRVWLVRISGLLLLLWSTNSLRRLDKQAVTEAS